MPLRINSIFFLGYHGNPWEKVNETLNKLFHKCLVLRHEQIVFVKRAPVVFYRKYTFQLLIHLLLHFKCHS